MPKQVLDVKSLWGEDIKIEIITIRTLYILFIINYHINDK